MDKKLGIIVQRIFGMYAVNTFRHAHRETKEVQTLTGTSMRSMLYNGDSIPHIESGKLFKIKLTERNATILGLSTKLGPIVMRITHAREVEVLMNESISFYYLNHLHDVSGITSNIDQEMLAFLSLRGHHKERWENVPTISEVIDSNIEQ